MKPVADDIRSDKEVLELFALFERTIGELYEIYSKLFPEHAGFWSSMALEEFKHARLLKSLLPEIRESCLILKADKAKLEIIIEMISRVKAQLHICGEEGENSIADALVVATSIEEALLENDVSEFIEGGDGLFRSVMAVLSEDTARHRDAIKRMHASIVDSPLN